MNRRELRAHKRKMRRVGIVLASMMMLATTAGLGGTAFASHGSGGVGGGGGGGAGGSGSGGLSNGPGSGSGYNFSVGTETNWCNDHARA